MFTKICQNLSGKCAIDGTVPELHCVNMKRTELDGVIRYIYIHIYMNRTEIDGIILCKYEPPRNRSYTVCMNRKEID